MILPQPLNDRLVCRVSPSYSTTGTKLPVSDDQVPRRANRCQILQIVAVLLFCLFGFPTKSLAVPIIGAPVTVNVSGDVIATYLGSTAYFKDTVYLEIPVGPYSSAIFYNRTSITGTTVNLGYYEAGTELVFGIHVRNQDTNEEFDFYTGSPSRNVDGQPHGRIDMDYGPGETLVEFEDLYTLPGFPLEFNDMSFVLSTIQRSVDNRESPQQVPEPATGVLVLFASVVVISKSVAKNDRLSRNCRQFANQLLRHVALRRVRSFKR